MILKFPNSYKSSTNFTFLKVLKIEFLENPEKFINIRKKPKGVGFFFLLGSVKIGGKKPHPLGFFPRNPFIVLFLPSKPIIRKYNNTLHCRIIKMNKLIGIIEQSLC